MKAFLSHSSKDKSLAREIAEAIRIRGGNVWLDERDLPAGASLASALSEALSGIDIFVVLITENSVTSPWVQYEIDEVMPRISERSIRVLPLRFGGASIPPILREYLYVDGSSPDALRRALNLAFASSEYRLPIGDSEIKARYEERRQPEFCIRISRTRGLTDSATSGPAERRYVSVADYFEQCGRPLREILENLFVGKFFDELSPDDEFSALVFEVGQLYEKKLDLLPGTWKAIYRVITDARRLAIAAPRDEFQAEMGRPPRDYWGADDHLVWYDRVRVELQSNGYPKSKDEEFLVNTFGIRSMCFDGSGRSQRGSRIFFTKNLKLDQLSWWRVDLGRVNAGNILN